MEMTLKKSWNRIWSYYIPDGYIITIINIIENSSEVIVTTNDNEIMKLK